MSENAPVPYRVEHPSTIEPIDESVIPDCGREESDRLSIERTRVERQLRNLGTARGTLVLKRSFMILGPLSLLPSFIAAYLGAIVIGWAFAAAFGSVFVAALISLFVSVGFDKPHENDETRTLRLRQASLKDRLGRFKSLERLTGKQERAKKFLEEVNAFNRNLERLADLECTEGDRLMIQERRADLLGRIHDFRTKILAAPPQLALLPSGNDDRAP